MTLTAVLTIMRDHTKVGTSGRAVVCVCGQGFDNAYLHTIHVAEQIAAGGDDARPKPPKLVPAGELRDDHLGELVVVPARNRDHGAGCHQGLLVNASPFPTVRGDGSHHRVDVLLELLHPGDAHSSGYVVPRATWIEVHQ